MLLLFDLVVLSPAYENASEMLITIASGQLDDFFPIVAFSALMKILKDSTLKEHHILCIHVRIFHMLHPVLVFLGGFLVQVCVLCMSI